MERWIVDVSRIFVGGGGADYAAPQILLSKYANRHGLIAGATGTGKTVTLQILAESFSARGVPVFLSDVKGDLSGLARAGSAEFKLHDAFLKRAVTIGFAQDYVYDAFPVTFWDLYGEKGHPVRTTVAEMGPLLLSRLLELSEVQEGVLNVAFRVADEEGLALLDLKDLQALLTWVGENRGELSLRYGNVATSSVGAIQRRLLVLENQGAAQFFGEPALDLGDIMATDLDGRGRINILAADRLMRAPRLYATFLLWLLSELFESLPEVGDPEKPRLVFFFDEAHLLFDDAPDALVDKVEQVARLIRSKGVGVYFITQSPGDVPEDILGQLGNRIQHALRAYTGRDQRELRAAAQTYRGNPRFDTEAAIREVGVGEAVTSLLEAKGVPGMVERTLIRPPSSQLGPITDAERADVIAASPFAGKYDITVERQSAHEVLAARAAEAARAAAEAEAAEEDAPIEQREFKTARRYTGKKVSRSTARRSRSDSVGTAFAKSLARSLGSSAGRTILRGVLGGLFKGR
ncbi:ATP-binding protein [Maritimibacter sp. 55A14]|uniref:helicase HerA-like domain-containing protein n=1 Tax=Maritimibacter sp. 55A14 TaxID=2174844 RepID=UPI000D61BDB5|nr:helicase HerA-like domain-containing protein [Maritimibacter sp. 55A14]PWE33190.1 ATP-binding protein [Maritimibacter sp. 55A14]